MAKTEVVQPIQKNIVKMGPLVTEDQAQLLCKPVSNDEVNKAIFSTATTKSPGPDGFNSGFF